MFSETDEESSSKDVAYYLDKHKAVIGQPDIAIAMDAGSLEYSALTFCSLTRGCINAKLTV